MSATSRGPVAIVGMACAFPGARDLEEYAANVLTATPSFRQVPADRWDPVFHDPTGRDEEKVYCRRGAFLDDGFAVAVRPLGVMPGSVAEMEPDQLISLAVAQAAVADAGHALDGYDRGRIGVMLGKGGYVAPSQIRMLNRLRVSEQLVRTLRQTVPSLPGAVLDRLRTGFADRVQRSGRAEVIGMISNMSAARIANRLDLGGPAFTVDGACASALLALDHAMTELDRGRCDAVLVGGVHHCHDISLWSLFAQLGALSRSGAIRPFDRRADGTLLGEGTGMAVVKRLTDAQRDGDRVYAVVAGLGVTSDGRSTSVVKPYAPAQQRALELAWAEAAADPAATGTVQLVEAHGTATPSGDDAELESLAAVFGRSADAGHVALGSVKSLIGHTVAAAGMAGLIKVALAVHHGVLPPAGGDGGQPHQALEGSRFQLLKQARPWPERPGTQRRAGVSSFGFGGVNAHAVVTSLPPSGTGQAAPQLAPQLAPEVTPVDAPAARRSAGLTARVRSRRDLRLAEPDRSALLGRLEALADVPAGAVPSADVTAADPGLPCRAAVRDGDPQHAAALAQVIRSGRDCFVTNDVAYAAAPLLGAGSGAGTGTVAFVYPGLEPGFRPQSDDLTDWLHLPPLGAPAGDIVSHARLAFRLGRILTAALAEHGVHPDAIAGLSIGEMTAAAEVGILQHDAVESAMDQLTPTVFGVRDDPFALLAAPREQVEPLLARHPAVRLTHDNAPRQCLVCGPEPHLRDLLSRAREQGVVGQVLDLRSGFHTPEMEPVARAIRELVDALDIAPPRVPLWSGSTGGRVEDDVDAVRHAVSRCLADPVSLRGLATAMWDGGVRAFVQLGAGSVPGLISQTLGDRPHLALSANLPSRSGTEQVAWVVQALWAAGLTPAPAGERVAGGQAGPDLAGRPEPVLTTLRPGQGEGSDLLRRLELGTPLIDLDPGVADDVGAALSAGSGTGVPGARAARADLPAPPGPVRPGPVRQDRSAPVRPEAAPVHQERLLVSTATMPYLLDHSFFRQPDDWPDETDRWPVMPGTTTLHFIERIASAARPGAVRTAVSGLRLLRWLGAAPAQELTVTVHDRGAALDVDFGGYATACVEFADRFPAAPGRRAGPAPAAEWRPELSAEELYRRRKLFHGPAYRTITRLDAIGEAHARGVLTPNGVPGSLLDGVGQLFGCWLRERFRTNIRMLPYAVDRIDYFGPEPEPGTPVGCEVSVTRIADDDVAADICLTGPAGTWALITGWHSRRFRDDPDTQANAHWPERNPLSRRHPAGWVWFALSGEDLPTRLFIMNNHLAAAERARYEALPPAMRRSWLLGRIAAKDAVRLRIWRVPAGVERRPVFPAQLAVSDAADGLVTVSGRHGFALPPQRVCVAHHGDVAVALAGPAGARPGIWLAASTDDAAADVARAAVRAAARAAGHGEGADAGGPLGDPAGYHVAGPARHGGPATDAWTADTGVVVVRGPGLAPGGIEVAHCRLSPGGAAQYVVAWTARSDRARQGAAGAPPVAARAAAGGR